MWMGLFPSVEGLTRTKDWLSLSKREFCQAKGLWALYQSGFSRGPEQMWYEAVWGDLLWGLAHVIMKAYKSMICRCSRKAGGPEPSSEFLRTSSKVQCLQAREDAGSSWRRARESTFLCLFILFVQWMGCYWSTLVGHFSLLTWLIQMLSLSEMLTDTSRNTFHQLSNNPLAQSGWHIKLTILDFELKHWIFLGLQPQLGCSIDFGTSRLHNHVSLSLK